MKQNLSIDHAGIVDAGHPLSTRRTSGPERGFALIACLLMMVLLTTVALGLISLSSISLRGSQVQSDQAVARANARLALQLAIGELQKQTGPDQRITFAADQIAANSDGGTTAADPAKKHWTGVYQSWAAADPAAQRPAPEFLSWLVSGPENDAESLDFAKSSGGGKMISLVGDGTLGSTDGEVMVPLVDCTGSGRLASRYGWWVADQNLKASIGSPALTPPVDLAMIRQTMQSSPRSAVELVSTPGNQKPFSSLSTDSSALPRMTGWKQSELIAASPTDARALFHDLSARSPGLMTNVRAGGFRKDLSLYLEQPEIPAEMKTTALYTAGGTKGINEGELWLYYNLYKQLKTGGSFSYSSGGTMDPSAPYLQVDPTKTELLQDFAALYKHPSFINIRTILSFWAKPTGAAGATKNRLHLVVDPIVTFWNPFDVPLVINSSGTPSDAYYSIKYWQLPYDITLRRAAGTVTIPMRTIMSGGAPNYMTLIIGKDRPVVLRPGEVLMFSQGGATAPAEYNPGLNFINARPGWNFGGGVAVPIKSGSSFIDLEPTESLQYGFAPNADQCTGSAANPYYLTGSDAFFREDRGTDCVAVGSGFTIDSSGGKPSARILANQKLEFFDKIKTSDCRPLSSAQLVGIKAPVMMFSYEVKTEQGGDYRGRYLARYNPKAANDLQTLDADEMATFPVGIRIKPLNSWRDTEIDVTPNNRGYFGGSTSAAMGVNLVTTNSIPREPLNSLASFHHSLANGFVWGAGGGTSSSGPSQGSYLLPQINHAIGNSVAPSVIPSDKTSSSLEGPRPLADHSYLANQALWDDWFLSGIAPEVTSTFSAKRAQTQVATDFFKGTKPLSNSRYLFSSTEEGETPEALVSRWFGGDKPKPEAAAEIASALKVDGMFNVNSTSVQAWKAVLSGLNNRKVAVRDESGKETSATVNGILVAALQTPENLAAKSGELADSLSPAQWTGYRELTEAEVESLARAVVIEVRKRGPFLSLSDFINRRPGSNKDLARAGAIQSALDSPEVPINAAYNTGDRAAAVSTSNGFAFPEAENGPASYGIPGVVTQADILTPLAPYVAARSDTFLIRCYGESVDANGKVTARAWCEAEVTRGSGFVDPGNKATDPLASLSTVNRLFGRRYTLTSFRWLSPAEI